MRTGIPLPSRISSIAALLGWLPSLILSLMLLVPALALAQERPLVTLDPGYGTVDDAYRLEITISGKRAGQLGKPRFDPSSEIEIRGLGMSTRSEFVNGSQSYQIIFAYEVKPKQTLAPGNYTVPGGSIEIDGDKVSFSPSRLTILPGSGAQKRDREPPVSGLDFTQLVDNEAPYVNEQVEYRAEVASSLGLVGANLGDLAFNGFSRESFGRLAEQTRRLGTTSVYSLRDGLFPLRAGEIEIPERVLQANVRVQAPRSRRPLDLFDDIFSDFDAFGGSKTVSRRLTAAPITLHVKELPPPPRAGLPYIPVGVVKVSSEIGHTEVKEGESVTLSIELNGDANLKPFELPAPSGANDRDIKIYVDKPDLTITPTRQHLSFRKVFRVSLVPQRAGTYRVPQYEVITFNPKLGTYETTLTPAHTLNVVASRGEERLELKGAQVVPSPVEEKEEIQTMGEDLYPIHVGESTYSVPIRIPAYTPWLVLLFGPLMFLFKSAHAIRNSASRSNPAGQRRRKAAQRALDAASAIPAADQTDGFVRLYAIFRTFLGDRFGFPGESITAAEAASRLPSLGEDLVQRSVSLLALLERRVYGGGDSGADILSCKANTMELIREIEKRSAL